MAVEKISKRKIMLIGTGFVGMSFAYSLLSERGIDELVLVDVNTDKAKGEEMDLSDGLVYADTKMKIRAGSYEDAADTNIVVLTAGMAQKPGQTRLELVKINAKITKKRSISFRFSRKKRARDTNSATRRPLLRSSIARSAAARIQRDALPQGSPSARRRKSHTKKSSPSEKRPSRTAAIL